MTLRREACAGHVEYAVEFPAGAERETTVAARVNQSCFRNRLMENCGARCCMTGLGVEACAPLASQALRR